MSTGSMEGGPNTAPEGCAGEIQQPSTFESEPAAKGQQITTSETERPLEECAVADQNIFTSERPLTLGNAEAISPGETVTPLQKEPAEEFEDDAPAGQMSTRSERGQAPDDRLSALADQNIPHSQGGRTLKDAGSSSPRETIAKLWKEPVVDDAPLAGRRQQMGTLKRELATEDSANPGQNIPSSKRGLTLEYAGARSPGEEVLTFQKEPAVPDISLADQKTATTELEPPVEEYVAAAKNITSFGKGLRKYTECLRLCYTKYDNSHPKVRAIRSQIVENTKLYREKHLKASASFISALGGVMKNYMDQSADEFAEGIGFIAERAAVYMAQAMQVKDLHLSVRSDTKKLLETAWIIADSLSGARDVEKPILERPAGSVDSKQDKAEVSNRSQHLVVSSVAGVKNQRVADVNASTSSIADAEEIKNARLAAEEIAGPMSECVEVFSHAISQAVKFFTTVNNHLQSFKNRAETAVPTNGKQKQLHEEVKNHYNLVKRRAANLGKACDDFLALDPLIDSELKRICSKEENHVSYIDEWRVKTELGHVANAPVECKKESLAVYGPEKTQSESAADIDIGYHRTSNSVKSSSEVPRTHWQTISSKVKTIRANLHAPIASFQKKLWSGDTVASMKPSKPQKARTEDAP